MSTRLIQVLRFMVLLSCFNCSQWVYAQLRDPTLPPDYQTEITSDSQPLTAIIISPNRKIAIIYGKAVKIGDQVGDSKVISIEQTNVQLKGPDGIVTLLLVEKPVKQEILK